MSVRSVVNMWLLSWQEFQFHLSFLPHSHYQTTQSSTPALSLEGVVDLEFPINRGEDECKHCEENGM